MKPKEVFEKMVDVSISNAMGAVQTQPNDKANAIYVAMGGVAGALCVMTLAGAQAANEGDGDSFDPTRRITPDTLLFFAILAAHSCQDSRARGTPGIDGSGGIDVSVEFGPETFFNALETFERATGRKIDGMLPKGMLEAARDPARRAGQMLAATLAAGRKTN
jgi:hypothetical protein